VIVTRAVGLTLAATAAAALLGAADGAAVRSQAPVGPRTALVLTSGPGEVITLRTAAGARVRSLRLGTYNVRVRDRSAIHNARVAAPGFGRATTVPYVGARTWRVSLKRTGTFRFLCDPHAAFGMRGSARIVR
jgi:hypothetical protein